MRATEDRKPATLERPERFIAYVCPDNDCPEWWPASHGSGRCGNYESHDDGQYPELRIITLIAEKDR
jgi:hypothetical protein